MYKFILIILFIALSITTYSQTEVYINQLSSSIQIQQSFDLQLKDREWICPECDTVHDRDYNAAINIVKEGKKLYKETIGHRLSELTPMDSSGYTLDEIGSKTKKHSFS